MFCSFCKIDLLKNKDLFGDLLYDCNFICLKCINIKKENWYCYITRSNNKKYKNHTYNGKTNNPKRRLRQHNGEIKGGAKRTFKTRPNEIYCLIKGFESNIEALQAEWRIKKPDKKKYKKNIYRGVDGRIIGLFHILQDEKFTLNSKRLIKDIKLTIWLTKDKAHLIKYIPNNITLIIVNKINVNMI